MTAIHPVILCGGSDTRLWPLSRKALPKPFLPLVSEETLFEQALRRVAGDDRFAPPIVVAGAAHTDIIGDQLGDTPGARLVIEPCARNTAPAIALAAALLPEDAVMLVCPSDHHIADSAAFRAVALAAAALAAQDYLVSFGIAPDRIEGAPDGATIAAYDGALLALPLARKVAAQDGTAQAGPGECLYAPGLSGLDFSHAEVTLLVRVA